MVGTVRLDWTAADRDYKKGQQLIKQGNWADGFKLHELRALPDAFWNANAKFPGAKTNFDRAPVWMPGINVRNKNLIIWSEAGWGDMLQFSRFIPLIKELAQANTVTAVYPVEMHGMLKRLPTNINITSLGRECPPSSYRIKMMSMPYLLMEHGIIPAKPADKWYGSEGIYRNQNIVVPKRKKPLIGICYDTTNISWNMAAKKIPKDVAFDVLSKYHKEFDFVSLQLNEGFIDSKRWVDTADKIQTLDSVISVDSAIAHCAASVGVRTINLIGDETMACWRWYPIGESTYWYDNMTTVWWDHYADWETGLEKAIEYLPKAKKPGRSKKNVV